MNTLVYHVSSKYRDFSSYPYSGQFTHHLPYVFKNVIGVRLSSVELPNIFYNFTEKRDNISFKIIFNTTTYVLKIPIGSYTSDLLLNVIQDKLDTINSTAGTNFKIIFNEISATITLENNLNFSLDFSNTTVYDSLGYVMGFRKKNYSDKNSYTSESLLNVLGEPYLFLLVNDYYTGISNYDGKGQKRFFSKIILDKNKTELVFDNQNSVTKYFRPKNPINLDKLEFTLLDYQYNVVDMNGLDFAVTIEFDFMC